MDVRYIKKVEHWRIDALKLWCWRRLFRVPWTARRSNQSILKEINPKYSLEGLMLKLKLLYFGHLMKRASSLEKTLLLGKTEGKRRRRWQRTRRLDDSCQLTQWTWVWARSRRLWRTGKPGVLQSMGSQRVRRDWVTEHQEYFFCRLQDCCSSFFCCLPPVSEVGPVTFASIPWIVGLTASVVTWNCPDYWPGPPPFLCACHFPVSIRVCSLLVWVLLLLFSR